MIRPYPEITNISFLAKLFFQNFHQFKAFVGLSDCRTIGPSDYRTVGLSDCRTIGLSDYSYGPVHYNGSLLYLQSDKISIGPYGDFFYYLNFFFDNFYSDMY